MCHTVVQKTKLIHWGRLYSQRHAGGQSCAIGIEGRFAMSHFNSWKLFPQKALLIQPETIYLININSHYQGRILGLF